MAAGRGVDIATRLTAESVTEGNPDKVADQISDSILDAILAKDPLARVACAATIATGLVLLTGEVTTDCYVDIPRITRQAIRDAGYTRAKYGFDAETCGVLVSIDEQSPDIAAGVDLGGAGDSGVVVGYACDETPELMPVAVTLAHRLARSLADARRTRQLQWLRPDGGTQVTVGYGGEGRPVAIESVVISAQHHDEVDVAQVRRDIEEHVIRPVLEPLVDPISMTAISSEDCAIHVNPAGRFVVGGPAADVGVTGRRPGVDTYGGAARHGGGTISGNDPTKVHRAGAYGARHVAKSVVAAGLATRCEIQVAYAIGLAKPVAVRVDTFGTGRVADAELGRAVGRVFDLSPLGIIKELNLRRPLYKPMACYGHFGRTDVEAPWEDTARKAAALKVELGG